MPDPMLTDDELTTIARETSTPQQLAEFMKLMTPETRTRLGEIYMRQGDHAQDKEMDMAKTMGAAGLKSAVLGIPLGLYGMAKDILSGHPEKIVTDPIDTVKAAAHGDPEAIGTIAGGLINPMVMEGGFRLANRAGTALATNPGVQSAVNTTAGSVAGALAAKQIGVSPFIGGIAGRNMLRGSELPAMVGRGLETITGGRADTPSIAPTPTGLAVPTAAGATQAPLSATDIAALSKQNFPPEFIARMQQQGPAPRMVRPASADLAATEMSRLTPTIEPMASHDVAMPPKVPINQVPASRSSGGLRAPFNPTLTVEDLKSLGINPSLKVTGLSPDAVQAITAGRASRAGLYRSSAELDAIQKALIDKDQ